MFLKCIISQSIIEGYKRGKSSKTTQRYLAICYGIKSNLKTIERRKTRLWLSGKLKSDRVQQN